MSVTPYMNLTLPTVSVTTGPEYATENNTAFTAVDAHNHTLGKGLPIPSDGISLNSALTFNGFDGTDFRSTRFEDQGSPLGLSTDVSCLYSAVGELYYNDGNGTQIQLTAGGALNAASIGGIGGDYGSSTATVFYTSGTTTYTFWQDTDEAGLMDCGAVTIRDTGASANGITLEAPNPLSADYTITLPTGLPSAAGFLTMSTTGDLSVTIIGQSVVKSSSTGTFSTSSGAPVDVTNATVNITTTGRPVRIMLQPDGTASQAAINASAGNVFYITMVRDASVTFASWYFQPYAATAPSAIDFIDDGASAGFHNYKLQVQVISGGAIQFNYMKLVAYEVL